MGRKVKQHAKLLERCFSRDEWEYLKRTDQFKARLEEANTTLDDFEELCLLGDRLLKQWEQGNPQQPAFHRVGKQKASARVRS